MFIVPNENILLVIVVVHVSNNKVIDNTISFCQGCFLIHDNDILDISSGPDEGRIIIFKTLRFD